MDKSHAGVLVKKWDPGLGFMNVFKGTRLLKSGLFQVLRRGCLALLLASTHTSLSGNPVGPGVAGGGVGKSWIFCSPPLRAWTLGDGPQPLAEPVSRDS